MKTVGWFVLPVLFFSVQAFSQFSDVQQLEQTLLNLHSGNKQMVLEAAEALAQAPYLDVAEDLIKRIESEIEKAPGRPMDTFILEKIFTTLKAIGTSEVETSLRALRIGLSDRLQREQNQTTQRIVLQNFDATTAALRARKSRLPFSPLVSPSQASSSWARWIPFWRKPVRTPAPQLGGGEAPPSASRSKLPPPPHLLTELFDFHELKRDDKKRFEQFASQLEKNLYDKSVKALRDTKRAHYYGRERELRLMYQGLLRSEKSHLLITGRAGVGKTTLLQMLSDAYVAGELPYPGKLPPLVMELPILDITNPSDPSQILNQIRTANELAHRLDRHVVLYVDEAQVATKLTRNAIKSFLTRVLEEADNLVHLVWSTTSDESREIKEDAAFGRRWIEVQVPEMNKHDSIEAIQKTHFPRWHKQHSLNVGGIQVELTSISPSAYEMAWAYASIEQPHASALVGMKEMLEGAIIHRFDSIVQDLKDRTKTLDNPHIQLEGVDIKNYLKFHLNQKLLPGDEDFDETFESLWSEFDKQASGNSGMKADMRPYLRSFFGSTYRRQMEAWLIPGPPGAGKSHLIAALANTFFDGALLTLKGSEYKNGGLELNKLIGSPPGTAGFDERHAVLAKFFAEHRRGVIYLNEGDAIHMDIYDYLTNMITDRKMSDALGKTWFTDNYLLVVDTNIGQEYMLPVNRKHPMNWDQFEIRRNSITYEEGDAKRVRPEVRESIFQDFFSTIIRRSRPNEDGSNISQESLKQMRRYRVLYMMTPDYQEILQAANNQLRDYVHRAKTQAEVEIDISRLNLEDLLELKNYNFFKGYSYVEDQLASRLIRYLDPYLSRRSQELSVSLSDDSSALTINHANETVEHPLPTAVQRQLSPWAMSQSMQDRIARFPELMKEEVAGQQRQIARLQLDLQTKLERWERMIVLSQIGSDAGGQDDLGPAVARVLFGSDDAVYEITGLQHHHHLNDYFRPPSGIQRGLETTHFEEWFQSHKRAGGGVIVFRNLLSFKGLSREAIGEKMAILNQLHPLFSAGQVKFGNKVEDAQNFVIIVTGDFLGEHFDGLPDSGYSDRQVEKMIENATQDRMASALSQMGLSKNAISDLGPIFLNGPHPLPEAIRSLEIKTQHVVREVSQNPAQLQLEIEPAIYLELLKRVGRIRAGAREIDRALDQILLAPLHRILAKNPATTLVQVKLINGLVDWQADGEAVKVSDSHQFAALEAPTKLVFSTEDRRLIGVHELYGHWMMNTLLHRKNKDESVVLALEDGASAFVAAQDERQFKVSHLSSLLKEILVLEAGHRAVMKISRVAAIGGGNAGRDKNRPTDDLGRVDQVYSTILANQLLSGFSDFSPSAKIHVFKQTVSLILKLATDWILQKGYESGEFEAAYERLIEFSYLDREYLDNYAAHLDWAKFPQTLFFESLLKGCELALLRMPVSGQEEALMLDLLLTLKEESSALDQVDLAPFEPKLQQLREHVTKRLQCTNVFSAS